MSKSWKIASVVGFAVLLLTVALAGTALAQQGTPTPGGATPAPTGTASGPGGGSGGMMSGTAIPGGMMGSSTGLTGTLPSIQDMLRLRQQMMGPQAGITGTLPFIQNMMGMMMQQMMGRTGMMGSGTMGAGMMGNGMMGGGMMGGMSGGWADPNASPLSLDQVVTATQQYIKNLPNNAGAGLAPLEVMEFSNGFYAAVGDKSGGAFEVLIDRYSGAVTPEPGPNMMWNNKYGMMGGQGMMGMMGVWTPGGVTPSVSLVQARANAQKFLDLKFPGTKLPADTLTFPGYYTLDFEKDGKPVGMLSVNAYTGQVWYHTWHGQFLSERAM
jgi:hypothetical protein